LTETHFSLCVASSGFDLDSDELSLSSTSESAGDVGAVETAGVVQVLSVGLALAVLPVAGASL